MIAAFVVITASTQTPVGPTGLASMLLALFVVLALIILLAWLFKRFTGHALASSNQLKMITHLNVGQRERLLIIEVGNQHLLLGVTSQQINCLYVLPEPLLISSEASRPVLPKFSQFMWKQPAKTTDKTI